jgi:hypothetical protein
MLSGGTRRSAGRAGELVRLIGQQPELFPLAVECLRDGDPVVCMRAADAAEKASRDQPSLLHPHKRELLDLAAGAIQQEVRWHLALMLPRLTLTPAERLRTCNLLRTYLEDRSSIVRTFAMQGLADLARQDPRLLPGVVDELRMLSRAGTPAMRARGRKLLLELESL